MLENIYFYDRARKRGFDDLWLKELAAKSICYLLINIIIIIVFGFNCEVIEVWRIEIGHWVLRTKPLSSRIGLDSQQWGIGHDGDRGIASKDSTLIDLHY